MAKNTRKFQKEEKKEQIKQLKARIKTLEKELRIAKSNNKTLNTAWNKTEEYLGDLHKGKPLEEVLEYKTFPKESEDEKEEARLKWKEWNIKNKPKEKE